MKDGVDGSVCALTPESVSTKIEELLENERQRKIYGCRSAEALLMEKPDIKSLFWN